MPLYFLYLRVLKVVNNVNFFPTLRDCFTGNDITPNDFRLPFGITNVRHLMNKVIKAERKETILVVFFITVLYCAFRLVFSWCPWLFSSSWKSTCPKMRRSSASERNSLGWAKDSFHKFRIIFRMILAHLDLINIFWTLKLTMNSSTARILKRFGAPKCFFSTQSPSSLEFPQEQVLQKKMYA